MYVSPDYIDGVFIDFLLKIKSLNTLFYRNGFYKPGLLASIVIVITIAIPEVVPIVFRIALLMIAVEVSVEKWTKKKVFFHNMTTFKIVSLGVIATLLLSSTISMFVHVSFHLTAPEAPVKISRIITSTIIEFMLIVAFIDLIRSPRTYASAIHNLEWLANCNTQTIVFMFTGFCIFPIAKVLYIIISTT